MDFLPTVKWVEQFDQFIPIHKRRSVPPVLFVCTRPACPSVIVRCDTAYIVTCICHSVCHTWFSPGVCSFQCLQRCSDSLYFFLNTLCSCIFITLFCLPIFMTAFCFSQTFSLLFLERMSHATIIQTVVVFNYCISMWPNQLPILLLFTTLHYCYL